MNTETKALHLLKIENLLPQPLMRIIGVRIMIVLEKI